MDRERAYANLKTGLLTAALAIFIFGMAFYVSILYLA